MAEATTAVALLFDEAGPGEHLRTALLERGARIVHEGPLSGLTRDLLATCAADVVVVNLDDEDDARLDVLYEVIEGDSPRVVFNDAQATRNLDGWDRARWARHLAMKVLATGDADPPRPMEAQPVVVASPGAVEAHTAVATEPPAESDDTGMREASESLEAELEALLAGDAPADAAGADGAAPIEDDGDVASEPAAMGGFELDSLPAVEALPEASAPAPSAEEPSRVFPMHSPFGDRTDDWQEMSVSGALMEEPAPAIEEPVGDVVAMATDGGLGLAPLDAHDIPSAPAPTSARTRLSDSWTLVDDEAQATPEKADPASFGIEKMSPADFLAPASGDEDASPIAPGLSLELVSLEEAMKPQGFEPVEAGLDPGFGLDEPESELARLVVLGATTEGTAAVSTFLAALPAGLAAVMLHTHHLAGRPAEPLVEHLSDQCELPVVLAEPGMRVRPGQVVVVPSDRQVRVRRDGGIELLPSSAGIASAPSIDTSFSEAAAVFGSQVVAIIFSGRSTDAVAGAQAVHDSGGQVWAEAGDGHPSDMVSALEAEQLIHFAGTPRELAARLVEHYSTEGR